MLKHALIRLRTAASSPFDLLLLLFATLAAVVFWPGLTDASGAGWPGMQREGPELYFVSVGIVLLWLVMWPAIASAPLRGQTVGGGRSTTYATLAHPALPIGPKSRILTEALTVLVLVALIRLPVLFIGEVSQAFLRPVEISTPWMTWYLQQTLSGSLVMLPFLLLSARAASCAEVFWLRALIFAAAMLGAMKLGWLATIPGCLAVCAVLSVMAIVVPDALSLRSTPPSTTDDTSLWRPALPPESQFKRDLWLRPLPLAGALVALEIGFIVLDRFITLPEFGFYFLSVFIFSFLLAMVPLQPMRSKLAVAGVFGKPGFQPGDFARACSVLPIRRRVISRNVFLFGFVTAGAVWAFMLGVIALSAWFDSGAFALVDADGDPLGRLVLPSLAVAPAAAALVTCAVFGDRKGALVSGSILLLLPVLGAILAINEAQLPMAGIVSAALFLAAPLPALKHLRTA